MEAFYVEAAKATTKVVITHPFEQVKLAWGIKDQFEKLKKEFTYIQALLQDIERLNQRHEGDSQIVNAWLQKVIDLAYAADNVMDDHAFKSLQRKSSSWELKNKFNHNNNLQPGWKLLASVKLQKRSFKKKCRNILTLSDSNPLAFRFRMSRKINHILRSFDDLYKDARKLGIRPAEMASADVQGIGDRRGVVKSNNRNSLDEVRELAVAHRLDFVGRRLDQEELTNLLCDCSNDEDISTIAIVGMGGLGKTTLARQLYEKEVISEHFTEKFWICISDNFTVKRVLCVMFEKLTGGKCELSNTEDIVERVQQLIRGKRYLLVLDDVWEQNRNKWTSLKNSLRRLGGATGCMTLVTTRNKDIAKTAESQYIHQLTGLSDEESWIFFMQKAFPKGIATYDSGLKEVGRKIVKKCKGLPLAINAIGGLLRMMEDDLNEWKNIENNTLWNLPQESNDILPSLLLSFNNLSSPSLKQCFAYCAIYPKEVLIDGEDLINLWNAQGFLHCQAEGRNLSPEELGAKYVDTLLNNSLLQAETRHSSGGDVTEYRMHYLVHDMALYISKHDWLIGKGVDRDGNISHVRHLAIFTDDDVKVTDSPTKIMAWLRTLHSTVNLPMDLLMHAKNLRVLKLAATGLEKVPPSIGKLHHLRYIDLSHNPIVMLPESLTSLYHLQTLRLFGYKLKELPQRLYRLVNLRHLQLTSHSWCLPRGIERLTALQTLPMLELDEECGCEIGELGALQNIKGLLSISGLEHVKSKKEAEKAGICKKTSITELQLIWGWERASKHLDVLDALEPPSNLKLLMITGYDGPNFPPWVMSMVSFNEAGIPKPFYNLVHIELLYCRSCKQLPALGHLPCLSDLSMYSMWSVTSIGDEFYHPSNNVGERAPAVFPSLRKLNIFSFDNLTAWEPPGPPLSPKLKSVTTPATAAFPLLEMLRIEDCNKLVQTPTNFPCLRHLRVDRSIRGQALYNVISESSKSLTSLNINEVPELTNLPDELVHCTSLAEFTLRSCPDLQFLPDGMGSQLTSLLRLSIVECPSLREIPASLGVCISLKKLCIRDCNNLEGIPDLGQLIHVEEVEINECRKLPCLLRGLQFLPRLKSLSIGGFKSLENESSSSITSPVILPHQPLATAAFPLLEMLRIEDCNILVQTPTNFPCLRHLRVDRSTRGQALYNVLCESSKSLTLLYINEVSELTDLPDELVHCTSLAEFTLRSCPDLQFLPDGLGSRLTSLLRLSIVECPSLREIPASLGNCISLEKLCIRDCNNLEGIPDLGQLIHVEEVEIYECRKLPCLPRGLQTLPHLKSLSIGGFKSLENESSSSITSPVIFPALQLLRITNDDCAEKIPDWIGNLLSLQQLELKWCKNLKHLPSQNVIMKMNKLTALIIESCPLLQERCAVEGPEWDKISHIRLVRVISKTV